MSYLEWSTTAGDNASADANVNWAEGQAPSSVNNASRAEMAAMASFFEAIGGALTTGGTGSAYTLTLSDAPTAYTESMLFLVKFHAVSASTTATINVNGLGAKTLKTWGGNALPSASYIPANTYGMLKYDGTDFRLFLPMPVYEEGTFTPTFTTGTVGDLSVSYATRVGRYTRLGNQVTFHYRVTFTPTHTTASGVALFQGLPFASENISGLNYAGALSNASNIDLGSSDVQVKVQVPPGVAEFRLVGMRDAAPSSTLNSANFPSGTEFTVNCSGMYQI